VHGFGEGADVLAGFVGAAEDPGTRSDRWMRWTPLFGQNLGWFLARRAG
jgi:hypothetical protein